MRRRQNRLAYLVGTAFGKRRLQERNSARSPGGAERGAIGFAEFAGEVLPPPLREAPAALPPSGFPFRPQGHDGESVGGPAGTRQGSRRGAEVAGGGDHHDAL